MDGQVTVVEHGHVRLKIVAGEGGENVERVAKAIEALGEIPSPDRAYRLARELAFGSPESLIVLTPGQLLFFGIHENEDDEIPARYRDPKVFEDPNRTPWRESGRTECLRVVNF